MKIKVLDPEKKVVGEFEVEKHSTFAVIKYPYEHVHEWACAGVWPDLREKYCKPLSEAIGMEVVAIADNVEIQVCEVTADEREARRQLWEWILSRMKHTYPDGIDIEHMIHLAKEDGFTSEELVP